MLRSQLDRYKHLQLIVKSFWDQWQRDYLGQLQVRSKWLHQGYRDRRFSLIKEDNLLPSNWKLGRVVQLHPGLNDISRVVTLKCGKTIMKRPVNKICVLPVNDEPAINNKLPAVDNQITSQGLFSSYQQRPYYIQWPQSVQ